MAKAVLPTALPGEFFVLVWSRIRLSYIIHIDDEDGSSFDLGGVTLAKRQLDLWGVGHVGAQGLDMAKEFGIAQVIPSQNRVIALFDREDGRPSVFDRKENKYVTFPTVRSDL